MSQMAAIRTLRYRALHRTAQAQAYAQAPDKMKVSKKKGVGRCPTSKDEWTGSATLKLKNVRVAMPRSYREKPEAVLIGSLEGACLGLAFEVQSTYTTTWVTIEILTVSRTILTTRFNA